MTDNNKVMNDFIRGIAGQAIEETKPAVAYVRVGDGTQGKLPQQPLTMNDIIRMFARR